MKNVLVTGFEPFGGDNLNPSALAAQALNGRTVAGRPVIGAVLPCIFGKSLLTLKQQIRLTQPELVICTGLSEGRAEISLERVAINIDDAIIPDNEGNQPLDQPIISDGPAAYWSTLPVKAIIAALWNTDIPAALSHSAGTFLCNHVFYGLMSTLATAPSIRGGFIHVPFVPEQAARIGDDCPSLPLEVIVRALEIAIETSLTTQNILHAVGGATD